MVQPPEQLAHTNGKPHVVLTATRWSGCYFSHFTDEEIGAQRSLTTCPRLYSQHSTQLIIILMSVSKVVFSPRLAALTIEALLDGGA